MIMAAIGHPFAVAGSLSLFYRGFFSDNFMGIGNSQPHLGQICFDGFMRRYRKSKTVTKNKGQNRNETRKRARKMIEFKQPVTFNLAWPS